MAVAAFINVDDTEFTLNGIPYDKTFLALPRGNNAIAVVGVYEGRNRILDNTPIADITVGGVTYGTVALLIAALKPVLYNYGEGGGGGGTGTTYLGKKPYTLNLFGIPTEVGGVPVDELDYVAAAIQRGNGTNPLTAPAFTCAVGQELLFKTTTISGVVLSGGGLPESYTITIRNYGLYGATITNVGGVGSAEFINRNSIYNDGERKIYVGIDDIEDLVTHFGEIGATPIEDKVNEGRNGGVDPYSIEGFRVFDCLRAGELFIYVFIGIPGEYGGNDIGTGGILEAFAEDFQDITDQPVVTTTNNYVTYNNIAAMLSGLTAQNIQNTLYVKDASADANITFPIGETKKHAFYKLKGDSETGTISDYVLVSAPYSGNGGAVDSVNGQTGVVVLDPDDLDDSATTNKFTTVDRNAKVDFLTVTQAVDLDAIETRVNELDAAVVLKGGWDASAGTFPGAGVAQAGWSYQITVAGTVDGVQFSVNDRIIAILDNASTTVYATNWLKADYSDLVSSINGEIGAVTGFTKNTDTQTLTNKRITMRVQSVVSSATVTPNADNDDCVKITAQAEALTLANPSGTPTVMQPITIRIKDNGTARAIAYGAQYRAIGITLPTTTVLSKTTYLGMLWNSDDSKWDVVGTNTQA